MVTASELPINTNASAMQMAQTIFGDGVTVVNASYSGDSRSSGIYSNGDSVSADATPGDTGVILSTGRAQDFTNSRGQANQDTSTSTNTWGQSNNSQFNSAAGARTYDAAFMDVDFIPTGNVMTMEFNFSSEEYPEFQNSIYQDFVGVWINGQIVDLAVGNGDIDVGNVNPTNNVNVYLNNQSDDYNTEMDGLTITMTLTMVVNPDVVNSIRIGIADVADANYDSNILIAANSVQTELVAIEDVFTIYPNGTKTLNVLSNDVNATGGTLTITHLNGIPVNAGDTITLATGQTVTLNADGTVTVVGDGNVESTSGDDDTGFIIIDSIPCFVAGTRIETPNGPRLVESLIPGDMIMTQDDGPQPLRWIGSRAVRARGAFAPVRIAAGTFGDHGRLMLSPLHRVLVRDAMAELLFGDREVLVAARDLVDGTSVTICEGDLVTYVHLLFDRHQVIFAEGLATESFLPGPQTTNSFEADIIEEICGIFPEIDPKTGDGYSPAARRLLRGFEARLLTAA